MDSSALLSALSKCTNQVVMVVGDLMLDEFHWCQVTRISPEAPVPVCKVNSTTVVPGGAANVAHNISALSNKALLVGLIGKDSSGQKLITKLGEHKLSTEYVLIDSQRPTILKSRIIAHQQQIARVDREDASPISKSIEAKLLKHVEHSLPQVGAIILSDYLKGTLTSSFTQKVIKLASEANIPIIVDPKGNDFKKYTGATVLTPNFQEFETIIKKSVHSEEEILKEGLLLIKKLKLAALLLTRSEKGMSLITKQGEKIDIPTKAQEVYDITGAGDTVISVFSVALSAGVEMATAAHLANCAAGIVVGKLGTATTTLQEIEQFICSH